MIKTGVSIDDGRYRADMLRNKPRSIFARSSQDRVHSQASSMPKGIH
jgi:hypothetical protein